MFETRLIAWNIGQWYIIILFTIQGLFQAMYPCENKLEINKQVIQCYVYLAVTHLNLIVFNLSTIPLPLYITGDNAMIRGPCQPQPPFKNA